MDSGGQLTYQSLSTELTTNTAKKKNLTGAGHGFFFRVSATTKNKNRVDKSSMDYMGHAYRRPFKVLTMMEQSQRMSPPIAKIDSSTDSPQPNSYVAHVSWQPYVDPLLLGYKLQMRESDGTSNWYTVAKCLSGTEVRKKNLTSRSGYMFRVRPVLQGEIGGNEENLVASVCEGGNVIPYSSTSDVVGGRSSSGGRTSASSSESEGLLKLFKRLPDNKLLARGGLNSLLLGDAFNKVDLVFLYASAHWCGPCRKYTPGLAKFYNDAKAMYAKAPSRTTNIEIVFVSADHDMNEFRSYYASMPWLAVPFDAETRERLLSWMHVKGIPQLMCLDGQTGKIFESNGVGRALDLSRFSRYCGRDKSSIR
jgi:thiol-disulfide isomerase/thioredoxin